MVLEHVEHGPRFNKLMKPDFGRFKTFLRRWLVKKERTMYTDIPSSIRRVSRYVTEHVETGKTLLEGELSKMTGLTIFLGYFVRR